MRRRRNHLLPGFPANRPEVYAAPNCPGHRFRRLPAAVESCFAHSSSAVYHRHNESRFPEFLLKYLQFCGSSSEFFLHVSPQFAKTFFTEIDLAEIDFGL